MALPDLSADTCALLWGCIHVWRAPRRADAVPVVAALFAVVTVVLAAPILGANVGAILTLVPVWALFGVSWNILSGYGGQLSFGHASFFGIGAYTVTLAVVSSTVIKAKPAPGWSGGSTPNAPYAPSTMAAIWLMLTTRFTTKEEMKIIQATGTPISDRIISSMPRPPDIMATRDAESRVTMTSGMT